MSAPPEPISNPVIKTDQLDDVDKAFLEAAKLHDEGKAIPDGLLPKSEQATPEPEPAPDLGEKPTEIKAEIVGERARGADGKFIKTDGEPQTPASEAIDASKTGSETEYAAKQREKKEKESARLEKTWENVNARKDAIEQRERQIAEREQRLAQPQRPQLQLPRMEDGTPMTSQALFTASQDFSARAKKAIAEGDYDTFGEQNTLAEQAAAHGQRVWQIEQQLAQETAMQDHQSKWVTNMQQVMKETPELTKADSPLSVQVQELLKTNRVFEMLPDGFAKAKEIAQLRLDAQEAPTLREQLKLAKEENQRLTALSTPAKGSPTSGPATKSFDKMSSSEQDAHIMRKAAEYDAAH